MLRLNDSVTYSRRLALHHQREPLSRATENRVRTHELSLMKKDAILVNLARGEIINETARFEHLQEYPSFTAGLDAWWVEPVRPGQARMLGLASSNLG